MNNFFHEKHPLFLILDLDFMFSILKTNEVIKKSFLKKKREQNGFHLKQKIIEDFLIFLDSVFHFSINKNCFLFFLSKNLKWIPFGSLKKKISYFKLKKIFLEELLIHNLEKEIKETHCLRDKENLSSIICMLFYSLNPKKLIGREESKIICFNSKKGKTFSKISFKKLISIGKKINCVFDSFIFLEENFLLNGLSFKTNGIYCKPIHPLLNLIYCKRFIQTLISFLLQKKNQRQFFSIGFPTIFSQNEVKESWYCFNCFSSFFSPFSECFLCGNKFSG